MARDKKTEETDDVPIAIVGASCRFAGAADPDAFWRLILEGRSALSTLSESVAFPIGCQKLFADRAYPLVGGLLGGLYSCVSAEQTFPRQMNAGENQDLYFATQLAFDALGDAGLRPHAPAPVRGSVRFAYAPPFSASSVNWLEHTFFVDQTVELMRRHYMPTAPLEALGELRRQLVDSLPAPSVGAFLSCSGNRIAAWIASECAFSGGTSAHDAGALSFLDALSAAVDDLRAGRVDVALAGAVMPPLSRPLLEGLAGEIDFSDARELVPFSRDARGTIPGEGGAFFVLKRRADALAAHDRIYALVRSVICRSGGAGAPLAEAAEMARVPVTSIGLVEADGTGIPAADAAEAELLRGLWGEHVPGGPLVGLGSVKGNVGHCFHAAGAAALLKAALALRARVLAPQVACERPIESIACLESPVYVLGTARPWVIGNPNSPRRAAVLAHDAAGLDGAVVLEAEPEGEERR